jgi:hypothetical protein
MFRAAESIVSTYHGSRELPPAVCYIVGLTIRYREVEVPGRTDWPLFTQASTQTGCGTGAGPSGLPNDQ